MEMKNSVSFIFAFVVVILVQEMAHASPTPIFLPKLSRFISDLADLKSDYASYYGGSYGPYGYYGRPYGYGRSYGGGYTGNSFGSSNPQRPAAAAAAPTNRQAQGRSYTDICRVFGQPGINTGTGAGVFCPYSG